MIVVLSDLQLPYHHVRALKSVCNFLADQASRIIELFQVGDFYDFQAVSRWVAGTAAEDGKDLQRELDVAEDVCADVEKAYPGPKVRIKGNRDDRLAKYLGTTAKGLAGLKVLEYDVLTKADQYGWVTKPEPYRLAPTTVAVHGLTARAKSGTTPHAHLDRLDGNIVHGHTHRAAIVYRTLGDKTRWAMEVGCLMDRKKASYLPAGGVADWQLAFGILHVDGNRVRPELVTIANDGTFFYGGKKWTP